MSKFCLVLRRGVLVVVVGVVAGLAAPAGAQPCPPCPGEEGPDGPGEDGGEPGELQVFFGYLHAHTGISDGQGTPLEAYVQARDLAGLDYLAITPHNHGEAGRIAGEPELYEGAGPDSLRSVAAAMTRDGEFVALYGQEFSSISQGNHVNVLDAPTVIGVANGRFDQLLDGYMAANKDSFGNDCLLVLNHPDSGPRNREYGRDDFGTEDEWVRRMDAAASILNLINGPSKGEGRAAVPGADEESLRFYLNRGFHVAPSVDQDNHRRTWGTIHDGRTAVVAPALTKRDVLDALRARHAYATTDRNLRVVCRVAVGEEMAEGEGLGEALCGDVVAAPAVGTAVAVTLDVADDDEPGAVYQVSVYEDAIGDSFIDLEDPVEEVLVAGDGRLALPLVRYTGGRQYFVIRIAQFSAADDTGEDADRVWLAPVWLEPEVGPPGPAGGGVLGVAAAAEAVVDAVAREDSEVYHSRSCPQVGVIPVTLLVEGEEAVAGRRAHGACTGETERR
jgi:hypothetical protein